MFVSINGQLVAQEDSSIPAVTDGLFYGAGCFETLKSYQGSFLKFEEHIDRLNAGIKFLSGSANDNFSADTIRGEISNLLKENNLDDEEAVVRIQASLGDRKGYNSDGDGKMIRIITSENFDRPDRPINLATSKISVVPRICKPAHLKLSNMLHYRQAAIEAKNKGFDDALLLTVNGSIAETSIANLFWESGGIVYTPSVSCDILPGIMRSLIIELLQEMEIEMQEGEFSPPDIMNSRHVWATNSVREIVQVSQIDDKNFDKSSEIISGLKTQLNRLKQNQLK